MDRRERYNDPEETLRAALAGFQAGVWTALPCIVQSSDSAAMTVVVQPSIRVVVTAEDGTKESVALPLLLDCPVIFPCGGGFTLTFPIESGDECLVMFASRCIDAWWQSGGVQEQAELRMHDLSDGFALVGVRSQPRVISGISLTAPQLRSDAGDSYVEVGATTIKIVTTAKVEVNAPDVEVNCDTAEVNAADSVAVDTAAATVDCETAEVNATTSLTVTSPLMTFIGEVIIQGACTVQGLLSYLAGLAGTGGGAGSVISGDFEVTGDVGLTGDLIQTGGNLSSNGVVLHTHTHSGVTAGPDNTGAPN